MVNQIGFLLCLKIDVIFVNAYFGLKEVSSFSAVQEWNNLLRKISSILSSVIGPVILISYAKNDINDLLKISIDFDNN